MSPHVVCVSGLTLGFQTEHGLREVLTDVSFSLARGEILALVGESGCGKTVTSLSLARLHPEPPARYGGGRVTVEGRDVLGMNEAELRRLRGGVVSYVFQEPSSSLNPVLKVGAQIAEAIKLHVSGPRCRTQQVTDLLASVGIAEPELRARAYPHELSGGMQQRVMIAMAISCSPSVLVADEPTTALDVTVQAQILRLLADHRDRAGCAILLVTHDLGVVAQLADRVCVMYAGEMVETAPTPVLLNQPGHPYTRALLRSVPRLDGQAALAAIPGRVPDPAAFGTACRFAPRCSMAQPRCHQIRPPERRLTDGHVVRCLLAGCP